MNDFWNALRGKATTTKTIRKPILFGLFSIKKQIIVSDTNLISHIRTITLAFFLVLLTHFFLAPIVAGVCALYTIIMDIFIEILAIAISAKLFESEEDYSISLLFTILVSIIVEIGLEYFNGTHNYLP